MATQASQLLSDFMGDHLSVSMFGAARDGFTDDAAAINAAVEFVGARGGGCVELAAGAYLIGSDIKILHDRVWLRPQGAGVTIRAGAANLNLIHWCGSYGGILQGLTLDASQVYTDLVIGGTTTHCTSAARPFTAAHVGASLIVSSGTGFTHQVVTISSVSGGVATCSASLGTAASIGGAATLVFPGVTGLRVTPLDEAQVVTVVAQSYNNFHGVNAVWCDEGIVLKCGPTVSGADSGCYYNRFYSCQALLCKRGVWLADGSGNSPNNRNQFYSYRCGQTQTSGGVHLGANTGIQIDAGDTNKFFAASFEGLESTTSPNSTATAIIVKKSSAVGADNNNNHFFGTTIEACDLSLVNYSGYTEIYGGAVEAFGKGLFALYSVSIVYGGSGYTTPPTVTFAGGGGGGAVLPTATAVLTGGVVSSITINTPGSGMTIPPTISFSGGGGSGAIALSLLSWPKTALGGGPNTSPVTTFGMMYPEGTAGGGGKTDLVQNCWNMYKGMFWPLQDADQFRLGGDLAGSLGVAKMATIKPPNANWGIPLLLITDGIGRGLQIAEQSFDVGVAGKSCSLGLSSLNVTATGASAGAPFTINSSTFGLSCLSASLPVQTDGSGNLISALIGTDKGGTGLAYANRADLMDGLLSALTDIRVRGKFGANGAAVQAAAASGGSVATTAATNTTPYGFTTAAQANAIITLLNNIRAALVANGIMS